MPSSTSSRSPGAAGKRITAFLILMAGLPVFIGLALAWSHLYFWLESLIQPHLLGFWADLVDGVADDLGIAALATAVISYLGAGWFSNRAEKRIPTRWGLRYLTAGACGLALAVLCLIWLLRGRLPFRLPYTPNATVMINLIAALGIYALGMVQGVLDLRKARKKQSQPTEHIWIFCRQEKPKPGGSSSVPQKDQGMLPFCCVLGGPLLVNEQGIREVPGRDGAKLDAALLMKVRNFIFTEEQVSDRQNWSAVYAFNGFILGQKAFCPDLVQLSIRDETWNYADLLHSPLFQQKAASFDLGQEEDHIGGDLRYCRIYRMQEDGSLRISSGKSPREEYETLISRQKAGAAALGLKRESSSVQKPPAGKTGTAKAPVSASPPPKPSSQRSASARSTETASLTPAQREQTITFIYQHSFTAIWAAIHKVAPELHNIMDIRDGKLSDQKLSALADALKRSDSQAVSSGEKAKAAPKAGSKALIHIVFDSSLSPAQQALITKAVTDTQQVFPGCSLEITGQGKNAWAEGIRKNMDSYSQGTQQENGRYDASIILQRLKNLTQYQKDARATLLFTGRDLCLSSQKAPWCFGAGNYKSHTAVCSVFRYEELTESERLRCIRRSLRHEIGHALGLAGNPKRINTEESFGCHCTAPGCSMRQTGTLKKLLLLSQEEEGRGQWFCPDCARELEQALNQTDS